MRSQSGFAAFGAERPETMKRQNAGAKRLF